jgi:hypothetical protein
VTLGAQLVPGQFAIAVNVKLEERRAGVGDFGGIEFPVTVRIECGQEWRHRVFGAGRRRAPELISPAGRRRHEFGGAELAVAVLVELLEGVAGVGDLGGVKLAIFIRIQRNHDWPHVWRAAESATAAGRTAGTAFVILRKDSECAQPKGKRDECCDLYLHSCLFFLKWQPRGLAVLRGGHDLHCCLVGQRRPQPGGGGTRTAQCWPRLHCRRCQNPEYNSVSHAGTVKHVTLREREGQKK